MKRNSQIYCLFCLCILWLMASCGGNGAQMRQQLEALEQQNRSGEQMLNDSLAESLVSYFDKHGDANERMRAKYILGRTYYCLGELPRALETYYEAADCADTTAADCDYKVLSRVYGQGSSVFYDQVQPRSQLDMLRQARYYAIKAKDTLASIEYYAQMTGAYDLLSLLDSGVCVTDSASRMFEVFHRKDRASQVRGNVILSLVMLGQLRKAKDYIDNYEAGSGFLDDTGNIQKGREVYYYAKGEYFLAINKIDSAEFLFRKELRDGKDLNNQIAGCKGLQKVFERKAISDSIAKYANLGYILNDSAYSLSEMQNIQKLQASYNYNHHKFLAEKKELEARNAWLILALFVLVVVLLGFLFGKKYRILKNAALDYRLRNADITRHFHEMAKSQPIQYPSIQDWRDLCSLVEHEIPAFKKTISPDEKEPLNDMDYDVCVAIRLHLSPIEISRLKQCSPATVTKIRKRLLFSIFGKEGNADDFDDEIGRIGNA